MEIQIKSREIPVMKPSEDADGIWRSKPTCQTKKEFVVIWQREDGMMGRRYVPKMSRFVTRSDY